MTTMAKTKENVIYLNTKDDLESVQYLQDIINGIRAGVVKKIVCITDGEIDLSKEEDMYLADEYGNKIEGKEKVYLTNNFFMGDGPMTELLGLNTRMGYILNEYMNNYRLNSEE